MARNTQNQRSGRPQGRIIGYARVSTDEQATDAQEIELRSAGCDIIVQEHGSGAARARPALSKLLREISAGDTLVVVRLDRLARSVSHLLEVIEDMTAKGAHFRSLRDPIDTSTPQGMFSLQVLGAVAQLERALISERTKAGIRAAKSKGKLASSPRHFPNAEFGDEIERRTMANLQFLDYHRRGHDRSRHQQVHNARQTAGRALSLQFSLEVLPRLSQPNDFLHGQFSAARHCIQPGKHS